MCNIDTAEARSLEDLIAWVETDGSEHRDGPNWFRGHQRPTYHLEPKVQRSEYKLQPGTEMSLALNFKIQAVGRHARCPADDDLIGWMTLMQHYGLPTRLLDWSSSILVAAFFATEPEFHCDCDKALVVHQDQVGTIWSLNPCLLNCHESNRVFRWTKNRNERLERNIIVFDQFQHPQHKRAYKEFIESAFANVECNNSAVLAVAPRQIDSRLVEQSGCFTIHGRGMITAPLDHMQFDLPILRRCNIPCSAKARIQVQLRKCGISRASLFRDLANLALDLANTHRS